MQTYIVVVFALECSKRFHRSFECYLTPHMTLSLDLYLADTKALPEGARLIQVWIHCTFKTDTLSSLSLSHLIYLYTVEPLHNGHLGAWARRKCPLCRDCCYGEVGARGVIWQFFSEVQHVYCDKFMLAAHHTMIIQITIKLKGNTSNVWIKMLTWQNEQGSHHSLEVFMQFKHTAAAV